MKKASINPQAIMLIRIIRSRYVLKKGNTLGLGFTDLLLQQYNFDKMLRVIESHPVQR